ncbi:hypothetical protein [Novosphingopyxis iocasae]|uniref:hypothetical protein n=1 Tax=Novosphingopyxis iocasae TaxID=2762729 RepID=UPI0016514FC2|nr:hypothetical protein [Novosphingopyxis iocasae]
MPAISETATDRGAVFTFTSDSGSSAVAHIVPHDALAPLAPALRSFAEQHRVAFATYRDGAAVEHVRQVAAPLLKATRSAIEAGRTERSAIAEADRVARTVPPSVDMSAAPERRSRYREMDSAAQVRAVQGASLADLAALTKDGNLAYLDPAAFELAERRFVALAQIERTGMMADHAQRPSLDLLTASGPDREAAERAANEVLARFDDRKAAMEAAERSLQSHLAFVAAALDMRPDEALAAVLAA